MPTQQTQYPLPRGLLILLGIGAAVLAVAGMKAAAGIIAPVFLALVLMITVFPIRGMMIRKRFPAWLATVLTILSVYAILIIMIVAIIWSIGRMAALVPTYAPQVNDVVADVGKWVDKQGLSSDQVKAMVQSLDIGKIVGFATGILDGVLGMLSNLVLIGLVALFLGLDAARFPGLLLDAKGERPTVVDALDSFAHGTRSYFAVSAIFGLIVAVVDTAALALMGIPAAAAWGVLAFVTNFVPNIGFIIGVIPPAFIALLEGGPGLMIAVIIVYCTINFIIQSVIQPKVFGDTLGLTTTLTFVSLIFWAFVLGPVGALLALPMTLLAKALLVDVDPNAAWLRPLLSGRAETPPDPPDPPESPDQVEAAVTP